MSLRIIVHKYGGTSMGSLARIKNVAKRIAKWHKEHYALVIVPSAMSGETHRLLGLVKGIAPYTPCLREQDVVAATGEQVSAGLLAIALQQEGVSALSYTGWQLPITTDNAFGKARICDIATERILKELKQGIVVVVTGFQGVDAHGNITTLGRGGSDTSAVALAAALKAEECLIYTDVDGVYTTDPQIVRNARRMNWITVEEMLEMASAGSKVLQTRSVEFAGKYHVKTRVLSSLTDPKIPLSHERQLGTLITFEEDQRMEKALVSGIACEHNAAKITVVGVPDQPGVAYQILGAIADEHIDVDMIIQNQSKDSTTDFTFTVARDDYAHAVKILEEKVIVTIGAAGIQGDTQVSKVSIVGVGMRSHAGVASRAFQALAEERINIQLISTSEIKISILIDEKYMELAVRALHQRLLDHQDFLE